jgi:anti-sigma factor (TIGR02949 family)
MTSKQKHDNYDCADIEELVQKFLDDSLDDKSKKAFEEHLEYCLPCDKKIEFEKKIRVLIKDKISPNLPSDKLNSKLTQLIKDFEKN